MLLAWTGGHRPRRPIYFFFCLWLCFCRFFLVLVFLSLIVLLTITSNFISRYNAPVISTRQCCYDGRTDDGELFVTVLYKYTHTYYIGVLYSLCFCIPPFLLFISFPPFTSPFQCLLITCPFYLFCYVFPVVNPFNKIPRVHLWKKKSLAIFTRHKYCLKIIRIHICIYKEIRKK